MAPTRVNPLFTTFHHYIDAVTAGQAFSLFEQGLSAKKLRGNKIEQKYGLSESYECELGGLAVIDCRFAVADHTAYAIRIFFAGQAAVTGFARKEISRYNFLASSRRQEQVRGIKLRRAA